MGLSLFYPSDSTENFDKYMMNGLDSDLLLHISYCIQFITVHTNEKELAGDWEELSRTTPYNPLEYSRAHYIKDNLPSLHHKTHNLSEVFFPLVPSKAAATFSIAIHIPKYHFIISSSSLKPASLPVSRSLKPSNKPEKSLSLAKNLAVATTIFSPLATSPLALAAKQIVSSPQEDNRGLILLVPVAAAVGWVLFNILGPALNQINRMRNEKMTIIGLGLGGLLSAASSAVFLSSASAASEVVESEVVSGGGNQGLLPLVVAGAVALQVVVLSSMQSKYEEKDGASH